MVLNTLKNIRILSFILIFLCGCSYQKLRPANQFNNLLFKSNISYSSPSIGINWISSLINDNGKEKIELLDLQRRRVVSLPGLNVRTAIPISLSMSSNGNILAIVRQRNEETELIIYRRNSGGSRRIEIVPKGIPRKVALDGLGKILAVEVSRNGKFEIDIYRL